MIWRFAASFSLFCLLLSGFACKTTETRQQVITNDYELRGFEKFSRLFDKETGVLVYVSGLGVSCLQVQKPGIAADKLTDKEFPDFGHKLTRIIDREYAVAIYTYCATMDYRTCDAATVKLSAK